MVNIQSVKTCIMYIQDIINYNCNLQLPITIKAPTTQLYNYFYIVYKTMKNIENYLNKFETNNIYLMYRLRYDIVFIIFKFLD